MEISSAEELTNNLSFIRWVKGTGTSKEMEKWDQWIEESPEHQQLAQAAQEKIVGVEFVNTTPQDLTQEWEDLENRIEKKNAFKNIGVLPDSRSKKRSWIYKMAAAILVLAAAGLTSLFIIFNETYSPPKEKAQLEWKTIETEYQQQKTIALSDGSTIRLNANSSVTYPAGWVRGSVTEVYLEGEAYFNIASRRGTGQPPFKVFTSDGVVEVMGTKFVVANSEEDTRVALMEGEVAIQKTDSLENITSSERYIMEPNQMAYFSQRDPDVVIENSDRIDLYTSWINQEIELSSSPLTYLIYRIEQIYGVNVIVTEQKLFERKLTGTIKLKDLDYLIQSISKVMDVEVTKAEGTVYFGNLNSEEGGSNQTTQQN